MQRCLDLACLAGKGVKGNPQVGAVLVYNHHIIGEGYHQMFGGAHAEVAAIENVPARLRHLIPLSTLYVSLEPCSHHGKTPPCCERIWAEGIKHVVVGCTDPNPMVAGKGIDYLRSRNIRVETDVLASKAKEQIRRFEANLTGIPYITLKWAQSKDLCISESGTQTWLSHPYTSILTHKWRSLHDAVLVGSQTAITDNPGLDVRHFYGKNPKRIVMGKNPDVFKDLKIWRDEGETWIINETEITYSNNKRKIKVPDLNDLNHILKLLYNEGIHSVMVEGGLKILKSFIAAGLWHEARVVRTQKVIGSGGIPAPIVHGRLLKKMNIMGDDILFIKNETDLMS
jgi:diaminohydroxyphosphoribosylaminopyrimidine deaminase/5-amino-6-(5-phosphoribosylamino)uracil reductase